MAGAAGRPPSPGRTRGPHGGTAPGGPNGSAGPAPTSAGSMARRAACGARGAGARWGRGAARCACALCRPGPLRTEGRRAASPGARASRGRPGGRRASPSWRGRRGGGGRAGRRPGLPACGPATPPRRDRRRGSRWERRPLHRRSRRVTLGTPTARRCPRGHARRLPPGSLPDARPPERHGRPASASLRGGQGLGAAGGWRCLSSDGTVTFPVPNGSALCCVAAHTDGGSERPRYQPRGDRGLRPQRGLATSLGSDKRSQRHDD